MILAGVGALPANGAVKMKNSNRSYADAYQQVNAMRYQQEYLAATANDVKTASATATLPVMVADEKLANEILNNTSETTIAQLDACSMIYPNGVFRWEIPESGIRKNQTNQCVAVVSLIDANTKAVLATTTVAAGDAIKCNIDSFPESGMNEAVLSNTILPADNAPTMDDVKSVLNKEQKQHAGLKIATGALISAVAGNALAKKDAGSSGFLGTGKNQIKGTAIGAVTGAGIMAASSYSGKVAGETINSTAVNAASGMIIGNMLAGQNDSGDYLVVQNCKIEKNITDNDNKITLNKDSNHDCIAGNVIKVGNEIENIDEYIKQKGNHDHVFLIIDKNKNVKFCFGSDSDDKTVTCSAFSTKLVDIELVAQTTQTKSFNAVFNGKNKNDTDLQDLERYYSADGFPSSYTKVDKDDANKDNQYYKIASAKEAKNPQHAYVIFDGDAGFKSYKKKTSELDGLLGKKKYVFVRRNSDGSVGALIPEEGNNIRFEPTSGDASDGGLVDITNGARKKGTLTGTAAGGALGGLAGYQGAKSEVEERWVSAVREYEDSLSNFVCMTGGRFLSQYNSYAEIPALKQQEEQ